MYIKGGTQKLVLDESASSKWENFFEILRQKTQNRQKRGWETLGVTIRDIAENDVILGEI